MKGEMTGWDGVGATDSASTDSGRGGALNQDAGELSIHPLDLQ